MITYSSFCASLSKNPQDVLILGSRLIEFMKESIILIDGTKKDEVLYGVVCKILNPIWFEFCFDKENIIEKIYSLMDDRGLIDNIKDLACDFVLLTENDDGVPPDLLKEVKSAIENLKY